MRTLPSPVGQPAPLGAIHRSAGSTGSPERQLRIWLLSLGLAALSAAVFVVVIARMPAYDESELPWVFFAIGFGLAEIGGVHLGVRGQEVTVTLAGIPLVIGFYFASPATLVLAQLAGMAVALVILRRQFGTGLVFGLALATLSSSLAVVVFRSLAPPSLDELFVWWMASFTGSATVVAVSAPVVALATTLAARRFEPMALGVGLGLGLLAAVVNTSVALVAVVFLRTNPQDLWLVLAPAIVTALSYRAYAIQRERKRRIEFLYDCARIMQRPFRETDTLVDLLARTREQLHAEVAEIVIGCAGPGYPTRVAVGLDGTVEVAAADGEPLLRERRRLLVDDQGTRFRRPVHDSRLEAEIEAAGLADAIIVPLRDHDATVGTLLVGNRAAHRGPFAGEDLRLLETLAAHAGVALANSGLVDRLAESLANVTQLAAAVQSSDDAILALAPDGTITAWNPAAERLLGYRGTELTGRQAATLIPEGHGDDVRLALGGVGSGRGERRSTTELLRGDGSRVPVSVTISPIVDAAGVVSGLSAIIHDETARTEADAALRQSVERFRRVFRDSPIGMALAGDDLRWTAVNEALCRTLERSEEELEGQRFDAFVHPEDLPMASALIEDINRLEDSNGFSAERRYVTPSGRVVWARVTTRPLRDAITGTARIICMIEDITDARLARQRVRDTEARLHRAVAAFTAVREPASVLRAVLAAARDLLDAEFAAIGVLSEDGASIAEIHFDGIDEATAAGIGLAPSGRGALSLGSIESGPLRVRDVASHPDAVGLPPGHPVITSFVAVPIIFEGRLVARLYAGNKRGASEFDAEDEGVATALAAQAAVVLENARINARTLELIEELDRANAELRTANDAKSTFLGMVSHELRTPLHSILVAAELVHDPMFGPLSEDRARELGATIQGSGRHLLGLIDDLVDLSRIEADRIELRPTAVPLTRLLEEIRRELAPMATTRNITLDLVVDPAVEVSADPLRIRQVLVNLLVNAIKFSEPGRRVWVDATSSSRVTDIRVHDTGIGIPEADLERIFEPFERLAPERSAGAGLGLAISRRLVELHGGRLGVSSMAGVGSVFTVSLPAAPVRRRQAAGAVDSNLAQVAAGVPSASILVVEDDVTALGLVSELLHRSGYVVRQARTLDEAHDRLASERPSLVLLDIRLGAEDGLDLARGLRADPETRTLPILALSADAMQHDIERALTAGCNDHAAKPVVARDLLGRIHALIAAA